MTTTELLQLLPLMREMFPKEIQQDWSLEEWDRSMAMVRERTLAALDAWREQSAKMENEHS